MRATLAAALSILVLSAFAQISPDLASIVQAEKDFAQLSIDKNIREAFLTNFDDQTLAFQNGEAFPGRQGWVERKASDAYLFWWPVWADVASSGDFGYTTGPAEWGGTQSEKRPVGGMYYSSVWRRDKSGTWRVMADLGTGVYDPAENKKDFKSPRIVLEKSGRDWTFHQKNPHCWRLTRHM